VTYVQSDLTRRCKRFSSFAFYRHTPNDAPHRCSLKSFTSCAFCGRLAVPDY